ncbi:hypothetical protein SGRIM128S_04876 [Streptomyces griseomycini]
MVRQYVAALVFPAPAGPMSSTAMVVPAGSGGTAAWGALGTATGPPGGSGTWPVVSGVGGAGGVPWTAGDAAGGGAGWPGVRGGGRERGGGGLADPHRTDQHDHR